jgi:hypothetical protein
MTELEYDLARRNLLELINFLQAILEFFNFKLNLQNIGFYFLKINLVILLTFLFLKILFYIFLWKISKKYLYKHCQNKLELLGLYYEACFNKIDDLYLNNLKTEFIKSQSYNMYIKLKIKRYNCILIKTFLVRFNQEYSF